MENKPVTLKLIAKELKLSISTVSKSLKDYPRIKESTKLRVKELAARLNFTPDISALRLRDRKSRIIGIILPNLSDHFFTRSIYGMEQLATANGYNIIISQSHDNFEMEVNAAATLLGSRVDGLIVAISKQTSDFAHLDQFEKIGIPVVYYTRNPSFNLNCHKVLGNTHQGCYMATEYLINRGHKKVAYLGGPKMVNFSHDRFSGYINALKDNDIPFNANHVAYTDFDDANTLTAIKNLFSDPENGPTALVAFKEKLLFDTIKFLRSIAHPELKKLECIGFGNDPIIAYLSSPPIASIEENPESLGEQAVALLVKLIHGDIDAKDYKKVIVNCNLKIHQTA
ncbi:LacI family DNA-binding transcriptional regulator [Pedobacter jeongneungensis]|uniref:LacI family DNA-binding transcriptional regulator n=1 Tax=Pedobacter jeongneungensis TaxID=947309 RepID=A0ABP8B334_9SPHI